MTISIKQFENLHNCIFDIYFQPSAKFSSELIEVKSLNSHSSDLEQIKSFSLVFQSNHIERFEQNIYKVLHPELDEMFLFLVPIEENKIGIKYEAIFN
jgi:hypothetical protein